MSMGNLMILKLEPIPMKFLGLLKMHNTSKFRSAMNFVVELAKPLDNCRIDDLDLRE